jgi:hypothetical protein
MRRILMALAAGSSVLAMPALAQTGGVRLGPDAGFEVSYETRGQCEAAYAHGRNDRRKDPTLRGDPYTDLSGSDYNHASRTTTRCEVVENNTWAVFFYADGY